MYFFGEPPLEVRVLLSLLWSRNPALRAPFEVVTPKRWPIGEEEIIHHYEHAPVLRVGNHVRDLKLVEPCESQDLRVND